MLGLRSNLVATCGDALHLRFVLGGFHPHPVVISAELKGLCDSIGERALQSISTFRDRHWGYAINSISGKGSQAVSRWFAGLSASLSHTGFNRST